MSAQWPLYFSHRESIEGKGFVAVVSMQGRCLVAREPRADQDGDAWVFYGVQPSSLSAEGASLPAAFAAFRERLKDILFGFADEAATFEEFHAVVAEFFNDVDADAETWAKAAADIRAGQAVDEDAVLRLPKRVPHETEPSCAVGCTIVNCANENFVPSPKNNSLSEMTLAAA